MQNTLKKALSLVLTAALCLTAVITGTFSVVAEFNSRYAHELLNEGKLKVQGRHELPPSAIENVWDGSKVDSFEDFEGSGTSNDPYIITNGAQLCFAIDQTTNISKQWKLGNDIYLNDVSTEKWYENENNNEWLSTYVGATDEINFKGHINGDGHTVYGIWYPEDKTDGYVGLVPRFYAGSIKNLGVRYSVIRGGNAGAFVGYTISYTNAQEVNNCFADETVTVKGTVSAGGIYGGIENAKVNDTSTDIRVKILNCYSTAVIGHAQNKALNEKFGGIIGNMWKSSVAVKNSYSYGIAPYYMATDETMSLPHKNGTPKENLLANVYSDKEAYIKEGTTPIYTDNHIVVDSADMLGESAKTSMPGLDYNKYFETVEGKTPKLKIFPDEDPIKQSSGSSAGKSKYILFENPGAGIEFTVDCEGDVSFEVECTRIGSFKNLFLTVIVDGEALYADRRIPADNSAANWIENTDYPYHFDAVGKKTFNIEGLEKGVHTIEIYNQSQPKYGGAFGIGAITVNGEFLPAAPTNNLYIEFVGDSITAGHGNIAIGETKENTLYSDVTRGWAYLAARQLNADWSIVAHSGIAATDGVNWSKNPNADPKEWPSMNDLYPSLNFFSGSAQYDFARQPDFIICGLGTNDDSLVNKATEDSPYAEGYDLTESFGKTIDMLKRYNPNVKIIWVYGMMTDGANQQIFDAVAAKGGEEAGIYTLKLPNDRTGGSGHPGLDIQRTYADTVVAYVKSIIDEKPGLDIWDGTKPDAKPEYQGAGTDEEPYIITNGAELYWAVTNNNDGVYFKLANDIYLNDFKVEVYNKIPKLTTGGGKILTDANGAITDNGSLNQWAVNDGSNVVFQGVIDGDYHVIHGLFTNVLKNVNSTGKQENYGAGLIPKGTDAQVINLGIENSYIKVDTEAGNLGYSVGALFGSVNGSAAPTVIKNSYIGRSVYVFGNVAGGFIANGGARNGILFENLYSLATLANPAGTQKSYIGAIGGGMWNLALNNPDDAYADSTAKNVYANEKLFGNKAPFCTNVYGTVQGGNGPDAESVAMVIDESKMKGLDTVMQLGEAFELRENDFPVLKGFNNDWSAEPDPVEPVRPEGEWDGSLDEELAGEGTSEAPYLVTNAGELAYVIKSGGVENAYYKMTCDIYLNDGAKIDKETGFIEEGYLAVPWYTSKDVAEFKAAEFDGAGHVVYGIYSNFSGAYKFDNANGCTALFPKTRMDTEGTVTIKNIGVGNSYMRDYSTAAAIVGYAGNSVKPKLVIENCFAEEDVTLVGYNAGGIFGSGCISADISNCYSLAKLVANNGKSGLASNFWPNDGRAFNISFCYSTGAIVGNKATTDENNVENFNLKGANALSGLKGFDSSIWYAVKDDNKYPMLRARGKAIRDIDENGIFEADKDFVALKKLLLSDEPGYNNGDVNNDDSFDIRDLLSLKKYIIKIA